MYLKSLQLIGFKSFAERTALDFLPGVTAIVGPNGCGKSNIADAIRWVLGEQSAKVLRGTEMSDVIFNGADGRKPIGMAEVSMTFAECDPKQLSLPGVNLDFSEVTITRRVYRDGAGEYLINKTPCRLRDIQNLFMDTGIGRSSYSLMAQGQIDQILSAHPEDRRMIFEEAAGINKYKHQKKEALRKLEYTEANLVRLTDIIKEVKRQIISLQRQAGKARRYKEVFDQLKALDTRLSRHKYDLLQVEITGLEAQIAGFAAQTQQFATDIASHESQVTDLRRSLSEIERAIADATVRDHELKSEAERHQQRVGSNTERIAEFEKLIENNRRETAGSEEKIHVQEQELARLNAEFAQIDASLAAEQSKLQTQQAAFDQLNAELTQKTRALKEMNDALVACESERARAHNDLGALDARKKNDLLRSERLSTEQLDLEEQRRALDQRLEDFDKDLAELRASVEPLRTALTARESELATVSSELAAASEQHHTFGTELSQQSGRLELLRQLFTAPDGTTMLGSILEVEPKYGAAIEAALSHNRRTILADDLDAARALLASGANNTSVAAPELLPSAANAPEKIGGCVNAMSVVRVKDKRFAPLVGSLLQNVVIANDLDAALAIRAEHPTLAVATRKGEFVSEHGILSAVSGSQIVEIGTLSDEIGKLQARTADSATRKSELERKKAEIEAAIAQSRAELHDKEVTLAAKQGEGNALATESRDLESKVHTVVFELTGIEQQDAEDKTRRTELLSVLQQTDARLGQLRDEQSVAQRSVNELQAQKEQQTQQLTEQRVAVGGVEHKRTSIRGQLEPIAGRVRDLRERMQTCTGEADNHTKRIEQLRQEITESEQKVVELGSAREQSQQQLSGLQHQRTEVATGIGHAEDELRAIRKQASGAQERKSGLDVALAQKRMEIQNLKDHVWQKYQTNLDEVHSDAITITVADQGPAVSQQVPLETDWDAIEQQAAEMQSKLDAMGPVNVEAINEYDELEQRYTFLTQQHDDLVKAKEQLLQVIAKINTTTKQLFSDTFEKVRTNFQAMFVELFGGGKANLLLVDENDPLESGIEIVAKPPGKQLQSITLLSGGEKTLTATALLFSIYMVKPSPFCVLDELDAPLDESNINRFIRILQRFITQSQFVIITHSKRTIGMADVLYGITMEDHGVSKVVSVKFSPREETERREHEKRREKQEDLIDHDQSAIDNAATVAGDLKPHEEPIRNDLLKEKEKKLAPITDTTPIDAPEPALGQPAPESLKAEVRAAVAAAEEVSESVKQTVAEASETNQDKSASPK
jgi:chromosome segregation protein